MLLLVVLGGDIDQSPTEQRARTKIIGKVTEDIG